MGEKKEQKPKDVENTKANINSTKSIAPLNNLEMNLYHA